MAVPSMLTQAQKSNSPFVNPYAGINTAASRYAGVQTPQSSHRPQEPQPPVLPPSPEPSPVAAPPVAQPAQQGYGVPSAIPPKPMGGAEFYVQERLAAAGGFSMSGKDKVGGMAAKRGHDKGKTREQIESDARNDWERMGPTQRDAYFKKASPARSRSEQQANREYDQQMYGTGAQGTGAQEGQAPGPQGSPSPAVSYTGGATNTAYMPNDVEYNASQKGYRNEKVAGKDMDMSYLRTPAEVAARNAEVNGTYGAMGPRVKYDNQGVTSDGSMTKVEHPDGSMTIATPYGMGSSGPPGAKGAPMGVPVSPQAPPASSPSIPNQAPQSPSAPTQQPWQGQPAAPVAPAPQLAASQVPPPAAAPWSPDPASTAGVGQSFQQPSPPVPVAYKIGQGVAGSVAAVADAAVDTGQAVKGAAENVADVTKNAPGQVIGAVQATGAAAEQVGGNFWKGLTGAPLNAKPLTGSIPTVAATEYKKPGAYKKPGGRQ